MSEITNEENTFRAAAETLTNFVLGNPGTSGASAIAPVIVCFAYRIPVKIDLCYIAVVVGHKYKAAFHTVASYMWHFDWPEDIMSMDEIKHLAESYNIKIEF